jgi:hypothetical protein
MVKTGRLGLTAVLLVPITRHGDQHGLIHVKLRPQAAGDLIAIHARQADVEQDQLGPEDASRLQRGRAVERDPRLMPLEAEQHSHALGGIRIVVDHQDPQACRGAPRGLGWRVG